MPGQCYSCGAEFGVFKKEHGCKNCGYSFCSKCLHSKTVPVPKRNNAKHHVCEKCSRILSGEVKTEDTAATYDLPQAYLKRMEALKDKENPSSAVHQQHASGPKQDIPPHLRKLDKPDRDIAMRLERLKESDKPTPKVTNTDISARLASLQGQPHQPDKRPVYQPPDRRLQQEQIDDLMDEIAAEIEIDAQAPDPVKDIEKRLNNLQADGQNASSKTLDENNLNTFTNDTRKDQIYHKNIGGLNEDDELEQIHRLIEQAAAEVQVDAQKALSDMHKDGQLMERLKQIQKSKQEKETSGSEDNHPSNLLQAEDDSDSEEDEDEAAKRIIQRYLEEIKIDEQAGKGELPDSTNLVDDKLKQKRQRILQRDEELKAPNIEPLSGKDLEDGYDDPDELPYCCICTEDAVIRCKDCEMDLFCQRCFRECHQEMDISDHRKLPYKAPKGYH